MIKEKKYFLPKSVKEAIEVADSCGDNFKFMAGGTDVMVNKFQGNETAPSLIDLTGIKELQGIKENGKSLIIGALTSLEEIGKSEKIKSMAPVLAAAALSVGSPLIRKTGSIGGNILCENRCYFYNQSEWWREAAGYCLKCNGDICIATGGKKACFSEMISDTAPALIALKAKIKLLHGKKETLIPLEDIYTGDGVKPLNIPEKAIVKTIHLPIEKKTKACFYKLRERKSLEFTSLTVVMSLDEKDGVRIVLSGVDPGPVVVFGNRDEDKDQLIKKALKGSRAVDNDMYSRKYRREMIKVYLKKCFKKLKI